MGSESKPRLRAEDCEILAAIDRYVRQYRQHGPAHPCDASDVLDGWVVRCEIERLVRTRLLTIVGRPRGPEAICGAQRDTWGEDEGAYWTVHLTPRAIRHFWPGLHQGEQSRTTTEGGGDA